MTEHNCEREERLPSKQDYIEAAILEGYSRYSAVLLSSKAMKFQRRVRAEEKAIRRIRQQNEVSDQLIPTIIFDPNLLLL